MRILLVAQWFVSGNNGQIIIPGGTERYTYGLAKQLQNNDHDVMILTTTTNNNETIGFDFIDGLNVYRFRTPYTLYGYLVDFLSFMYTLKSVKNFEPDIIHVVSTRYRFAIGAVLASKLLNKKVVFTKTMIPNETGRNWMPVFLDKKISINIIKKCDVLISLSTEMRDALLLSFPSNKLVSIPNPTMKNYYNLTSKENGSILFVGRVEMATKGIDHLIKALFFVKKKIPCVKLHICGKSDNSLYDILNIISENNLKDDVIFHGHLTDDELSLKYSTSNLIVLPSITEGGASYVLLEAMSAGLPVIAYDLDCFNEALDGGKYGILVKQGDVVGLANNIIKLLMDEKLLEYYSKMSTKRSEKYSPECVIKKIESVYFKLQDQ